MTRTGKVIDNNDSDKKGKIKVRIFPELSEVPNEDLPWAKPIKKPNEHFVPKEESFVFVQISDDWTKFYYEKETPYISAQHTYQESKDIVEAARDSDSHTYPYPYSIKTEDGSVLYYNEDTKECGLIHSSGLQLIMKSDGAFSIVLDEKLDLNYNSSTKDFTIKDINNVILNEGGDDGVLYSKLKAHLDEIFTHTHSWSITLGSPPEGWEEGDPVSSNVLVAGPYPVTGSLGTTTAQSSQIKNNDASDTKSDVLKLD